MKEFEIGDDVIFIPPHFIDKKNPISLVNCGIVTSTDDSYVYVMYSGNTKSHSTIPHYLYKVNKNGKTILPFRMNVTPEQSKIIQEFLFANGYTWIGDYNNNFVQYTNSPFLYFSKHAGSMEKCTLVRSEKDTSRPNYYDIYPAPEYTFDEFVQNYF
jgi:hypothetical protein